MHTCLSHGASLIPKWSRQDRRDWGVSAAVWERLEPVYTWFSHRPPLSPRQLGQDRLDSGVFTSLWQWLDLGVP